MELEHIRLLVSNFAECFRFYRDVMGFKVTWGNEEDSYASFSDREGADATLALFRRDAMAEVLGTANLPAEVKSQDRYSLIVRVDDIDAVYNELIGRGVKFELEPQSFADWGIRSAYLRDPDGNLIELHGELEREEWSQELSEATRRYENEADQ